MEKAALESNEIYITSIQLDYRPFYIEGNNKEFQYGEESRWI